MEEGKAGMLYNHIFSKILYTTHMKFEKDPTREVGMGRMEF